MGTVKRSCPSFPFCKKRTRKNAQLQDASGSIPKADLIPHNVEKYPV
jgi:hypothetical protein